MTFRVVVFLLCSSFLSTLVHGACPNKCSGHGSCGTNDVCSCKQNWMGGDCSLRVCPYTRAWVDSPKYENDAHYYAECGNKGSCDRTTGVCVCDAGYTGSGCRRQVCPNDCSGHGTCEFIDEWSSSVSYVNWDQEKIMGCKCDPGFEGHDCASKICPRGDDPVTSYDQYQMELVLLLSVSVNEDNFYLTYSDPYGNAWTTSAIDGDNTVCDNIQNALRAIPNHALDGVVVTGLPNDATYVTLSRTTDATTSGVVSSSTSVTVDTSTGVYCKITFPSKPGTSGLQSLQCHTTAQSDGGSQPLMENDGTGTCSVLEYSASSISMRKLTELATCSNRGICDGSTGDCQCFAGHRGLACETQEALV